MAFNDYYEPTVLSQRLILRDSTGMSYLMPVKQVNLDRDHMRNEYTVTVDVDKEILEQMATSYNVKIDNQLFTNKTTNMTVNARANGGNMHTRVVEQAVGFVGTVSVSVDGTEVPVADTKPYKTYDKAYKAVRALAVKHAKK
jgi:hypothetical protein